MYRTTFLCEVQFATQELFDSTFGEQQKKFASQIGLKREL